MDVFRGSSVAEPAPVKRLVAGSNPALGASFWRTLMSGLLGAFASAVSRGNTKTELVEFIAYERDTNMSPEPGDVLDIMLWINAYPRVNWGHKHPGVGVISEGQYNSLPAELKDFFTKTKVTLEFDVD